MRDPSDGEAPAALSTFSRALLVISLLLASYLFGSGFENFMDEGSNWVQGTELAVPALLILCVGYVLIESSRS